MAFSKDWNNLVLQRTENQLITYVTWTTVPTDATAGYAKGCLYIKTDASAWVVGLYQNVWTSASCNFDAVLSNTASSIDKTAIKYTVEEVTITAAASWTVTVTSGAQIVWFYVTAITWTESVKTVDISWTTLTVTLTWSDTATVKVVVLD